MVAFLVVKVADFQHGRTLSKLIQAIAVTQAMCYSMVGVELPVFRGSDAILRIRGRSRPHNHNTHRS